MALQLTDLVRGDILLKQFVGGLTHHAIRAGQLLEVHKTKGSSNIVHAAVFLGPHDEIGESSGGGLSVGHLTANNYHYEVYRHQSTQLAELAASIVESYIQEGINSNGAYGSYSQAGAFGSIFRSLKRGSSAKQATQNLWGGPSSSSFYCSNFVVRSYLAAGATMSPPTVPIALDFRNVSPKDLDAYLHSSKSVYWSHAGSYN